MKFAGIILLIMALGCFVFVWILRRIFMSEEVEDMTVDGVIVGYRTEQSIRPEKPIVTFIIDGKEQEAYADSIPLKGRPEVGSKVKIAVRKEPIKGDENRWHAHVIGAEKGMPFAQEIYIGLIIVCIILVAVGSILILAGSGLLPRISRG